MTITGNLAEPVRGELDSDGCLIAADPLLLNLHLHCGGREGGPLAVPQLANLCRLSKQLNMNLSRSVQAADDDMLINLWVETRLERNGQTGGVSISIIDWKEVPTATVAGTQQSRERDLDKLRGRGSIRTDGSLRIMALSLPGELRAAESLVGRSLLDIFAFEPASQKDSMIERVAERQPIRGMNIRRTDGQQAEYRLSGQPLLDNSGLFSGYRFALEAPSDEASAMAAARPGNLINDSLFGSQLGPALRQPLGKIIANAETIGSRLEGPLRGDYASYARDIASAGRHLMDLVDDLSDLEAIERRGFSVAADDIDLVDLAHRVAGLLAVKAADHQIRIDVPDESEELPAKGEFRRVLQILVNLVGNAIRYSPDGSVIKIRVKKIDAMATIAVTDQGDGIAEADQRKIFEKFERLGRSGDGGSGLGLFISQRLATAMDGTLSVDSVLGKGTTFTLAIPAR